jgi:aminopeptidase N
MKKLLYSLLFFSLVSASYSQVKTRSYLLDPKIDPREHNVNFTNLRLEVSFESEKGLVKGKATLIFTPYTQHTDSIWLDGIKMDVKKITVNGKEAQYKTDSAGITIYPPAALVWESKDSLTVVYECTPRKGMYFIGWNDPNNLSRKQIWTQGEALDNRFWIPMFDDWNDKMVTETIITFDKDYQVLSNGTRLSVKENNDGTKTWHYKISHPQAPYLVMIGIGKYDIEDRKTKTGVPIHLYYYPEMKDRVQPTYKYMADMIEFYEKEIGIKFPWESYSQIPVQDYMFGAMENTTATVYGDFYLVDARSFLDKNYISVDAHELAHQWFGDLVTGKTQASLWMHENFATYYSAMFDREAFGKDYFDWDRRTQQNAAIEDVDKNNDPIASSMADVTRRYPQGAFVLNMLKYVVGGREIYNKAIKHYLEEYLYNNVDGKDLLNAFEETTGMSLGWYWEEWYYKSGLPNYNVSFNQQNGATEFSVSQIQIPTDITGLSGSTEGESYRPAGLFKMPIWFEVHYTDGTMDKKQAWIEKQNQKVSIPNPSSKKIDYVLFDPDDQVLKMITFDKPFEMLKAQAEKAENLLDRYDAVAAMRSITPDKKRDFLIERFHKETFHAIRDEVVAQLINDSNEASRALIKQAIADKDVQVRKAAITNVKMIPASLLLDFEKFLADSSYDIVALTLEKLSASNPSGVPGYLAKTKGVIGTVGRNVEVKWLETSTVYLKDSSSLHKLVDYTSNSYEFRTRVNAAQALKRLDYFDNKLLANLCNAILSPNTRLATPAGEVLQYFYSQDKNKKVIADYTTSGIWARWQIAMLRKAVI